MRPRKFIYKSKYKNRSLKFSKNSKLSFGCAGLLLLQPIKLNSKQLFRYKLFLKKAYKRSDKTLRYVWFNMFPHLPITKKVKGSRMGKGKGKLSGWSISLSSGLFILEFKNLRPGRLNYFTHQLQHKLVSKSRLVWRNSKFIKLTITNIVKIRYNATW